MASTNELCAELDKTFEDILNSITSNDTVIEEIDHLIRDANKQLHVLRPMLEPERAERLTNVLQQMVTAAEGLKSSISIERYQAERPKNGMVHLI